MNAFTRWVPYAKPWVACFLVAGLVIPPNLTATRSTGLSPMGTQPVFFSQQALMETPLAAQRWAIPRGAARHFFKGFQGIKGSNAWEPTAIIFLEIAVSIVFLWMLCSPSHATAFARSLIYGLMTLSSGVAIFGFDSPLRDQATDLLVGLCQALNVTPVLAFVGRRHPRLLDRYSPKIGPSLTYSDIDPWVRQRLAGGPAPGHFISIGPGAPEYPHPFETSALRSGAQVDFIEPAEFAGAYWTSLFKRYFQNARLHPETFEHAAGLPAASLYVVNSVFSDPSLTPASRQDLSLGLARHVAPGSILVIGWYVHALGEWSATVKGLESLEAALDSRHLHLEPLAQGIDSLKKGGELGDHSWIAYTVVPGVAEKETRVAFSGRIFTPGSRRSRLALRRLATITLQGRGEPRDIQRVIRELGHTFDLFRGRRGSLEADQGTPAANRPTDTARLLLKLLEHVLNEDQPEQARVVVQAILNKLDSDVLPALRAQGEPLAFVLPTAHEWLVRPILPYLPDTVFDQFAKAISVYSDLASGLFFGLVGIHLRWRSPRLLRTGLPKGTPHSVWDDISQEWVTFRAGEVEVEDLRNARLVLPSLIRGLRRLRAQQAKAPLSEAQALELAHLRHALFHGVVSFPMSPAEAQNWTDALGAVLTPADRRVFAEEIRAISRPEALKQVTLLYSTFAGPDIHALAESVRKGEGVHTVWSFLDGTAPLGARQPEKDPQPVDQRRSVLIDVYDAVLKTSAAWLSPSRDLAPQHVSRTARWVTRVALVPHQLFDVIAWLSLYFGLTRAQRLLGQARPHIWDRYAAHVEPPLALADAPLEIRSALSGAGAARSLSVSEYFIFTWDDRLPGPWAAIAQEVQRLEARFKARADVLIPVLHGLHPIEGHHWMAYTLQSQDIRAAA